MMGSNGNQSAYSFINSLPEQSPDILENLFCLGRRVLAEPNKQKALQSALQFAAQQSGTVPVEIILFLEQRILRIHPQDANSSEFIREQSLLFAERCRNEIHPVLLSPDTGLTTIITDPAEIPARQSDSFISVPILKGEDIFGVAIFSGSAFPGQFSISLLSAFGAFIADTASALMEEYSSQCDAGSQEKELRQQFNFDNIVGHNEKIIDIMRLVSMVAASEATILIQGETGTGKDVIAQSIYQNSDRKNEIFVPINCGAIPEQLLESELFGHTRGAFTSATDARAGWFEKAHGGTIFLDEISEMSSALQVKLLRILQTGEYSRIGSTELQHSDVRIIAATNRVLADLVQAGQFRDDLFYRLNVIDLNLPPLRDRKDDIPALASHFLNKYGDKYGKQFSELSGEVIQVLQSHDYPGNCRELDNIIQAAVILAPPGEIRTEHLTKLAPQTKSRLSYLGIHGTFRDSKQFVVEQFEQNFIKSKLEASGGNISQAARSSGMDVKNFHTKMTKYGIDAAVYK